MIIRLPSFESRACQFEMWHKWFAWHPVSIHDAANTFVWLQTVDRKYKRGSLEYGYWTIDTWWWCWLFARFECIYALPKENDNE